MGELAEVLAMAQSGISRHLAALKAAGLVQDRKEGTSNLFSLLESSEDVRAQALMPLVSQWLSELPEAEADRGRLGQVLAARRSHAVAFFQDVAPHWDGIRAAQHGEDLRDLALLELLPRNLSVLDVGTGHGLHAARRRLKGRSLHRRRSLGRHARTSPRETCGSLGIRRADLREGSMESLPVGSEDVDVVLGNMVLHHAEIPSQALEEMARVLRPGGRIVLTDLARHDLDWTREELADVWPGFEPRVLQQQLEEAGFDDVRVRRTGSCTLSRRGTKERHDVGRSCSRAGARASRT